MDEPGAAAALFAPIAGGRVEVAAVAYLDGERRLLGMRHLVGARDWMAVPIRDIVRDVLAFDARATVLAHTHPSGSAGPSRADLAFTRRLALCLDALDVVLVDHLVLANGHATSLRAAGML